MALVVVVIFGLLIAGGFAATIYVLNRRLSSLKDDTALGRVTESIVQAQANMNDRLDKAATAFSGLQHQLGQMQELGRSMRDIQDVLKSPKMRGNVGEQLMTDLIKQQIPKHNYGLQHAFRSGSKVDAVIKTSNGLIPIDSKFPAENFLKFIQANDEIDKSRAHKEFVADVKKHILAISKKYIIPSEGTVDFALMYVPGEAIFYEIMTNTDLSEYAGSQRVYLVSPHSFYYFLQTVLLSLEGDLIEEKAKEVMGYLKSIQSDARQFGIELSLVNKHMTNAKNAIDSATNSYSSLGNKIESASQLTIEDKLSRSLPSAQEEEVERQETLV